MRIIRFHDSNGNIHYGTNYKDGSATILTGDLFTGLTPTNDRQAVQTLLAPIPTPPAILCIGLNYRQHAEETGADIPERPVLFMKNPAALHASGSPIVLPPCCTDPHQVDFEVELAVVIGDAAKNVAESDALNYVLGYSVANDVSARWWQKKGSGGQWNKGKSFDTFCPVGPELVTADEVPNPQALQLSTVLNRREMQNSNTADMIFSVAKLIEFLSMGMTLLPGTLLLTGTPSGVGVARDPQVFIKEGDQIEMAISQIGTLSNSVIHQ